MKRINARFIEEEGKLLMVVDPSKITSFVHAEEILRDLVAHWVKERRHRGVVAYESLPTEE